MPEVSRLQGVVEIDGAERAGQQLAGVQAGFEGAATSANKSVGAFGGAVGSITDLSSAMGIASDVIQFAGEAYENTIAKAAAWGDDMGDLAQITNSSVEETSRLAATLELMGVKSDSLGRVVKAMNKEGLEFNLETLLRLNREYNAIQDPVAKTQFIFDKFGKSGEDMAEILGRDESAIRDLAAAADQSGKVIDEVFAQKAETWNVQMGILSQQAEGLGITLGGTAMDGVLGFLGAVEDATDGWMEWVRVIPLIGEPMGAVRDSVEGAIDAFDVSTKKIDEQIPVIEENSNAVDAWQKRWIAMGKAFDPFMTAEEEAKAKAQDAEAWISNFQMGMQGNPIQQENENYASSIEDLGTQAAELKDKIDKLTASNGAYYETVEGNGMSTAELELATQKLAAAQSKLAEETDPLKAAQLRVEIEKQQGAISGADHVVGGYVDNSKKIGELTTEYDKVKAAIEEVQKAHETATAQIVLDILTQKLAIGGLSDEEKATLETAAREWGIYEGSTIQVIQDVDKAIAEHGGNATAVVNDLGQSIEDLPSTKYIDIMVRTHYDALKNRETQFGSEDPSFDPGTGGSGGGGGGGGSNDDGGGWGGGSDVDRNIDGAQSLANDFSQPSAGGLANVTIIINDSGDPRATANAVLTELADRGLVSREVVA